MIHGLPHPVRASFTLRESMVLLHTLAGEDLLLNGAFGSQISELRALGDAQGTEIVVGGMMEMFSPGCEALRPRVYTVRETIPEVIDLFTRYAEWAWARRMSGVMRQAQQEYMDLGGEVFSGQIPARGGRRGPRPVQEVHGEEDTEPSPPAPWNPYAMPPTGETSDGE